MRTALFAAAASLSLLMTAEAEATVITLSPANATFGHYGWWETSVMFDGFYTGTSSAYFDPSVIVYLHDDSGLTDIGLEKWPPDGTAFDVLSLSVFSYFRTYQTLDGATLSPYRYDHVAISGIGYGSYDNGYTNGLPNFTEVVFDTAYTTSGLGFFFFQPANFIYLEEFLEYGAAPGTIVCDEWCGGLKVKSITVRLPDTATPVPLPASVLMLLAPILGGAGMAGFRRLRARGMA